MSVRTFSIVVPVYNIEEHIEGCVNSILEQTDSDYELILVDDGSTDRSGEICEKYRIKYGNSIRTFHKENGGLSDARNYGVRRSEGEYLIFVDGDDYIERNAIQALKEVSVNKPDIILSNGMYKVFERRIEKNAPFDCRIIQNISGKDALRYTSSVCRNWSACGKAFRTAYWKENAFEFVKGKTWEDFQLIDRVVLNAKTVCMIPTYYYYVNRNNSITHNVSEKNLVDLIDSLEEWIKYIEDCISDDTLASSLKTQYARLYCETIMGYLYLVSSSDREELIRKASDLKAILSNADDFSVRLIDRLERLIGFKGVCKIISIFKQIGRLI